MAAWNDCACVPAEDPLVLVSATLPKLPYWFLINTSFKVEEGLDNALQDWAVYALWAKIIIDVNPEICAHETLAALSRTKANQNSTNKWQRSW